MECRQDCFRDWAKSNGPEDLYLLEAGDVRESFGRLNSAVGDDGTERVSSGTREPDSLRTGSRSKDKYGFKRDERGDD